MSDRIEINSAYIEQITSLIEANNSAELILIIADLHIGYIAEIIEDLSKYYNEDVVAQYSRFLFNLIGFEKSAAVRDYTKQKQEVKKAAVAYSNGAAYKVLNTEADVKDNRSDFN